MLFQLLIDCAREKTLTHCHERAICKKLSNGFFFMRLPIDFSMRIKDWSILQLAINFTQNFFKTEIVFFFEIYFCLVMFKLLEFLDLRVEMKILGDCFFTSTKELFCKVDRILFSLIFCLNYRSWTK